MKKIKDILKISWAIVKIILVGIFTIGGAIFLLAMAGYGALIFFMHLDNLAARWEGHVKWGDPCFKSYYIEKGPVYEIQGDRVCMEFRKGVETGYSKTLEGADAKTFHKIDFYYFADKEHVYYRDKIVEGVNPNNFKAVVKRSGYFTDGKNVYYDAEKLDADINSFTVMKNKKGYFSGYAKDKNYVWKDGKKLEGVNPTLFIPPTDN